MLLSPPSPAPGGNPATRVPPLAPAPPVPSPARPGPPLPPPAPAPGTTPTSPLSKSLPAPASPPSTGKGGFASGGRSTGGPRTLLPAASWASAGKGRGEPGGAGDGVPGGGDAADSRRRVRDTEGMGLGRGTTRSGIGFSTGFGGMTFSSLGGVTG